MSLIKFWHGQTPEDQKREREAEWEQKMKLEWFREDEWLCILRPEDLKVPYLEKRFEIWKQKHYPRYVRP